MTSDPQFPNKNLEQVLEATHRHWDLTSQLPLPKPGWLHCPLCGYDNPQIRWWKFFRRNESTTTPYRCDMSWKCTECAMVWVHGIAVTGEMWKNKPKTERTLIPWREGAAILGYRDKYGTDAR